jgi:uncharacterized protein YydD (DUF2326 family)
MPNPIEQLQIQLAELTLRVKELEKYSHQPGYCKIVREKLISIGRRNR